MKRVVVVGGTSTIAQHCIHFWAQQEPTSFVLVGRNLANLNRVCDDLNIRYPQCHFEVKAVDMSCPKSISDTVDSIFVTQVDIALVAHGTMPDQRAISSDLNLLKYVLDVTGTSVCLWAEALANAFEQLGDGKLGVIGSVAGDRGRRSNYSYGAAKGMIERYVEGLQHRLSGTGVSMILLKPGPTRTPMTQMQSSLKGVAQPRYVGDVIVRGINRCRTVVYAPPMWRPVMTVVKLIPRKIMNRLSL